MSRTKPRVYVVLKRSSWSKWVEEEHDARIVALLEAGDESVRRMRPGHLDHTETVEEVRAALADLGCEVVWHDRPHHFRIDGRCDLVVTVGGDGTLLGASLGIGLGRPASSESTARPRTPSGSFAPPRRATCASRSPRLSRAPSSASS